MFRCEVGAFIVYAGARMCHQAFVKSIESHSMSIHELLAAS